MSHLRAIIFDVDGTLAETERHGHRIAFNKAFVERGLDWHWTDAEYRQLLDVAGGKERINAYADRRGVPPGAAREELVGALHAIKTAHYRALVEAGQIPLRSGVARLIREARAADIRVAIATTSSRDAVLALLRANLGSAGPGLFAVIAAADSVEAKKPAPAIYDYVLRELGLQAANAVAIEDSEHGVRAAVAAGMPVLVTVSTYTGHHDLAGAAAVVDHLGEPDRPCRVLAGTLKLNGCVTVATLRDLVARQASAQQPSAR